MHQYNLGRKGKNKTKQNTTTQAQNLLFTFHLCCTLFLWSLTGLWILTEDQSPTRHNCQPLTKYLTSFLNASFSFTRQNPSASVYKSLLASEQFLDLQHTLSTQVCEDRRSVAVCDLPSLQLTSLRSLTSLFPCSGQMLLQLFSC